MIVVALGVAVGAFPGGVTAFEPAGSTVGGAGTGAAAGLLASLWTYDAWGRQQAQRFEADHADDPAFSGGHGHSLKKQSGNGPRPKPTNTAGDRKKNG